MWQPLTDVSRQSEAPEGLRAAVLTFDAAIWEHLWEFRGQKLSNSSFSPKAKFRFFARLRLPSADETETC
jgi:hypothetical protein